MTESVYDGAQTAADILYGYRSYLRAEMVNLTNEEIEDLIKKLEKCADNSHGPRRHEEVRELIDICRTELDERDLVHCLVEAGLIVGSPTSTSFLRTTSLRRTEIICEKDVEDGKAFWAAAVAPRVILPNGEEAEPKTYKVSEWYLLDTDDEYWLYFVEDIHHVNYAIGARMVAYPVKEPYEIYDKSEYEYRYKLGSDTIVIKKKSKPEQNPFLKVIYRSKSGAVLMLDSLEDQLKDFDEKGLTALQYELDMFREDFNDFLTPEQVEWFNQLYDIVASELDARWLLKKLEERRIVRIERSA